MYASNTITRMYAGLSRAAARLTLLISILFLVSACTEPVARNYANAIGPDLYASSTVKNTRLLEVYSSHLCYQASLPITKPKNYANYVCKFEDFKSPHWNSYVQMGVYDIDRRCDAFLESLYYKEKSRGPILRQITNTSAVTREILNIAAVSNSSIRIVAAAFDFASNSFSNVRNGLLEALDQTTVKSIVYGRQKKLKEEIAGATFTSKPQAFNALRAYLRVCMPFTIEMEANAVLTTVQRNGGNAGNSLIEAVVGVSKPTDPATVGQGTGSIPQTPDTLQKYFGIPNFTVTRLKIFQRANCSPVAATVGPRTRAAITIVEQTLEANNHVVTVDGFLSDTEYKNIVESQCSQKFANYFEKISLAGGKTNEIAYFNNFVAPAYRKVFNTDPIIDGEPELVKFRPIIAELRRALSPKEAFASDFKVDISNWITPRLEAAMKVKILE